MEFVSRQHSFLLNGIIISFLNMGKKCNYFLQRKMKSEAKHNIAFYVEFRFGLILFSETDWNYFNFRVLLSRIFYIDIGVIPLIFIFISIYKYLLLFIRSRY